MHHLSGEAPYSGGVAEWTKALVLKTSEVNASQGSNPCPSANRSLKTISYMSHTPSCTTIVKGLGTQDRMDPAVTLG